MSTDDQEPWSPEGENLPKQYMKEAMEMMRSMKKQAEPQGFIAPPQSFGYAAMDDSITIRRIANGWIMRFVEQPVGPQGPQAVEVFVQGCDDAVPYLRNAMGARP